MARYFLMLLLSLQIISNSYSLENKFKFITSEDGLSQGNITCIFQDSKGFMWFGTYNGLNRYDGYTIKVFNTIINDSLSLGNGWVKYICEDDEQKLWLGTNGGGVCVYNPKSGDFKNLNKVKIGNRIIVLRNLSGVAYQSGGDIWVLDEMQGLFVFDIHMKFKKAYLTGENGPGSLPVMNYFSLNFDSKGKLWIGAGNGTLFMFNKEKDFFEKFIFEERLAAADDGIRSMYIDKKDKIWIGTTSQGVYSFNSETSEVKNYRQGTSDYDLSGNTVRGFFEDDQGNLLIGIDGGGLNILNLETGIVSKIRYELGNSESLNTDAVYAIYIDRTETLWIGTYAGGINYIGKYKNKFYTYKPDPLNPNGLSYKNVKCFFQDRDGDIWIGTDGGGINKFNRLEGTFTHYKADPTRPSWIHTNVIINMMQDSDGDIYIGSYGGGLTIFNKKENTFKQYLPDEFNPASIAGIHAWFSLQDSYGEIWIGFLAVGLDKFEKKTQTFKHYQSDISNPKTLNNPNVKIIFEDKNRKLWIGTEGGGLHLYNREDDNFTRYFHDAKNPNSISDDDIRSIYEDNKNRLWVGTGHGLNLMDRETGTFRTISSADGLAGDIINDILEDNLGNLWISTNKGISKFNPETGKFRNYDVTDGLQGNEFNYTAALKSKSGEFYFGGKNGFNVFRPEEILDNPHIPAIVLTDFQIANKSVPVIKTKIKGEKVNRTISDIEEIRLSYKQNIIGFEFSALDFGNPIKNKYKYKLEGFDKEWTDISALKRSVTYTNLNAGKYVFRVIGSNSDDKWNTEGLRIGVVITPPFWKRAWFILLVLITITILIVRYIKVRQQTVIDEKIILEEKISKGLAEVEKHKVEVEKRNKELQEKYEAEKINNYQNNGLSRISEVISRSKDDLKELTNGLILEIVNLVEVQQGALYILNDDNQEDAYLEVIASFAPDDKRITGKRIETGEGTIGACFSTKNNIKLNSLPQDYAHCASGLGDMALKYLVAVPLKLNESVIGVVELLSFYPLEEFKIIFVEKAGETLTAILSALKANEKTKKLLENQKELVEQSAAAEEELRQNLEELQATQEDLNRQMEANKISQVELAKEKILVDTLLKNAKEAIYFKDDQSRFIKTSESMAQLFNVKKAEELYGKSDFDFFTEEHARPAFDDEMEIIKTGKPIIDKVEKETHADGRVKYVSTSKMPLFDENGKTIGTFGISKDVTESVLIEHEIKQRNEELQAQEEELRQNLEEMQTVQENLENQVTENKKMQEKLTKEKALLDAIMNNLPDYIYFKDNESRFIRISKSMLPLFPVKKLDEMIGKSDFDFQPKEIAQKYYEDELKIIKSGKGFVNDIAHEVMDTGVEQWVATTKLPLYDETGKCIGTFGISKDITELKDHELAAERYSNELKQKEKELLDSIKKLREENELIVMKLKEFEKNKSK